MVTILQGGSSMKRIQVSGRPGFHVLLATRDVQAATMVIAPRNSSGVPSNEHPDSEQWVYVISGSGRARVGRRRTPLRRGTLFLIEKGEMHQILNTARVPLVTLNFYSPPAYTKKGELRKRRRG